MNEQQVKNLLGLLTGAAFLVILVRSAVLGEPVSDRLLVIFGALIYAYLQIDISAAIPFLDLSGESDGDGGDREG